MRYPLPSRDVGDRLRHLRTPNDFAALSAGGTALAEQVVKVIVDLARGDALHLLGTRDWALHYTFIREAIDKAQRLNLCDATQNAVFHQGWIDFSAKEYFVTEGRHYLLGTLAKHAGTQLQTLEFAVGDAINGAQMKFKLMLNPQDPNGAKRLVMKQTRPYSVVRPDIPADCRERL